MRISELIVAVGFVAVLSACESINRDSDQTITIWTEPTGAIVILSDGRRCTAPCEVTAHRYQALEVIASHPGCRSATGRVGPSVIEAATELGGSVYDYQLGGAYDLQPNPLNFSLECGSQNWPPPPVLDPSDTALVARFGTSTFSSITILPVR